tara:strand:+ start:10559 stop:11623 length:1065 start_codon:yes stop_codon:yes gene_type:complete
VSQVTNFTVENAAGNVVRQDINNILDAIKTNNSGGSDPSNPAKFMLYGKDSDDTLRVYDGSNFRVIGDVGEDNLGLLPKTGGTMTGALLADDGSGASTPAIAFDGDTDTGLFRKSANTIGLSTAGTERAIVDSNGITIQAQGDIRLADSDSSNYVALQAASTVSSNITFTLPSSDGSSGEVLQTNGSGVLSFVAVQGTPTGAVFCMAVASVPTGFLECNGASISRTTYSALFAVIGTTYGSVDSNTFTLPDLRGEFIRGFDNSRGIDSGRSIGTAQSDQNKQHSHSVTDPGHTHTWDRQDEQNNANYRPWPASNDDCINTTVNTGSSTTGISLGNSGGTETRPRNIAMMYVIKT